MRLSWSIVSPVLVYTNIHEFRIMYVLKNAWKRPQKMNLVGVAEFRDDRC